MTSAVAALGFVLAWGLEERPLREAAATSRGLEASLAVPKGSDSLAELGRAIACATTRRRGAAGRRPARELVGERA